MPETSDHDAPKRLSTMGEIRTHPQQLRAEAIVFSGLMVANLGWKLLGHEQIALDGSMLTLTAAVVGIRRARAFPIGHVRDVQVFERSYRAKGHPMVRRTVGFRFEGREVSAISQVSQAEAEYIRVWLEHELNASTAAMESHTASSWS